MDNIEKFVKDYIDYCSDRLKNLVVSGIKMTLIATLLLGTIKYCDYKDKKERRKKCKECVYIISADELNSTLDEIYANTDIIPCEEQITIESERIKNVILSNLGKEEKFKFFEKMEEIKYYGVYNGEFMYGVFGDNGKLLGIFNGKGVCRIDNQIIENDILLKKTVKKDFLKSLGYMEESESDGSLVVYKIDKGKKQKIYTDSEEYFKIICALYETFSFFDIMEIVYINNTNPNFFENGKIKEDLFEKLLFFRALTFDDIDIMRAKSIISEKQYNEAKKKIAKYYFRLVYLGIIKKEDAPKKTKEYFNKGYIDSNKSNKYYRGHLSEFKKEPEWEFTDIF